MKNQIRHARAHLAIEYKLEKCALYLGGRPCTYLELLLLNSALPAESEWPFARHAAVGAIVLAPPPVDVLVPLSRR